MVRRFYLSFIGLSLAILLLTPNSMAAEGEDNWVGCADYVGSPGYRPILCKRCPYHQDPITSAILILKV